MSLPDDTGQSLHQALAELTPVALDGADFLSVDHALERAAGILFPAGVQTEEEYQAVQAAVDAALAELGFGATTILGPPTVPFSERGPYRKKLGDIDRQVIRDALARRTPERLTTPYLALETRFLGRILSRQLWNTRLAQLDEARRRHLARQLDHVALAEGWQIRETLADRRWRGRGRAYVRPLAPNRQEMERALSTYLTGRPVPAARVQRTGLRGAFGDAVLEDPEGIISPTLWATVLETFGYETAPRDDGFYHPRPMALPDGAAEAIVAAVNALAPVATDSGPALLAEEVYAKALEAVGLQRAAVSELQREQLLESGPLGRALVARGYEPQPYHCYPRAFLPPREQPAQVFWRFARYRPETRRVSFADGAAVLSPVAVVDGGTLVYLELLGPPQKVKANWAALKGNRGSHSLNNAWVRVSKQDGHQTLRANLPCGWAHWALVHRQAAQTAAQPGADFYVLDDGRAARPASFPFLLERALELPVLPGWAPFLWAGGRTAGAITPLTAHCHGQSAWRVSAQPSTWQEIISAGLQKGSISF